MVAPEEIELATVVSEPIPVQGADALLSQPAPKAKGKASNILG